MRIIESLLKIIRNRQILCSVILALLMLSLTPLQVNAQDTTPPVSQLDAVPSPVTTPVIDLLYSAGDGGSGVQHVELFYRRNGGAWTQYGGTYTASPISFDSSATGGDGLYEFYSLATDNSGNTEDPPLTPDAKTIVVTSFIGSTVFVDRDATGAQNGESWTDACREIASAIVLAAAFGVAEIWVAEGTYYESITLVSGVSLYGGFAGNEAELSQRDFTAHPTIIDAKRVAWADTSVVTMEFVPDARIDGFVITGGYTSYGGGIYIASIDNTNVIANCIISGNRGSNGGGINIEYGGSPTIINCIISGNESSYGGGIRSNKSSPTIINCIISGNTTAHYGGGVYNLGSGSPTITNCTISSNTNTAGYTGGGGVSNCNFPITNTIFEDNNNVALTAAGTGPTLTNCLFYNNPDGDYKVHDGAIYTGAAEIDLNVPGASNSRDGDPLFVMGASGTWSNDPSYDSETNRTTLIDSKASFNPGALVGHLINPDSSQRRQALITANTDTTIQVSGDVTDFAASSARYQMIDYHLANGSAAIDAGTDTDAPSTDLEGEPRPFSAGYDIGADEYTGTYVAPAPTVYTVVVQTGRTVDVTFDKAMGAGVATASNYVISGSGRGTMLDNPVSVTHEGDNTYRLTWNSGEMLAGGDIIITVANVLGWLGYPIGTPNSSVHPGGGIGTAPTAVTITPITPSPTNSTTVSFTVSFSENVQNFDAGSDLVITETGTLTHQAVSVTGGPQDYTVEATGVNGEGTVALAVSTSSDVIDYAGNILGSSVTSSAVTVDNTYATVSEVVVQTGLTVDVTFSEPMGAGTTTPANYAISGNGQGTLTDNPDSVTYQGGTTYRLTWNSGEMLIGGDVTITVLNVWDTAGNPLGNPNSGTHLGGGIGVAPNTTATPNSGLYNAAQQVALICTDDTGSGCAEIYYTVDGSEPTTFSAIYSSPIPVNEDATLKFFAVDHAGNVETIKTETYVIDRLEPSVTITTPQDGSSTPQLFIVQGNASDTSSGVSLVELQITDGTFYVNSQQLFVSSPTWLTAIGTESWSFNTSQVNWTEGTTYTVTARAIDVASNTSSMSVTFTYEQPKDPSSISCLLSSDTITLGEPLRIYGQITPAPSEAGRGVDISLTPATGSTVHVSALADINGEFSKDLECGDIVAGGTWTVHTSWAGDSGLKEAVSDPETLEISKAEASVTVDLTSQAVKIDEGVHISGKFTPQPDCGADLTGIPILLVISGPQGSTDTQLIQTSNQWGQFLLQDYDGFDALGAWTVQAVFGGNDAYDASSSMLVDLKVVETAGYGIVVQGKISNEEGLASHNKTANSVYDKLKDRGLLDDDIRYFNYDTSQPGVHGTPTKSAIRDAITQWARDKINQRPSNLYIVLVDHGLEDVFYIHPDSISSTELDSWLDTLQAGLTGTDAPYQEIVIILGFCRSGSFINDISGNHRVIITSAAKDESSYKGPLDEDGIREGEYFVSEFFKSVSLGKSVAACFKEATTLTEIFTASGSGDSTNAPYYDESLQHPLLDDNGDGIGSNDLSDPDGDGSFSEDLFIGVSSVTGNDPGDVAVIQVAETKFLSETEDSIDLWARVDDNTRLRTIWVELKPPNYQPVDPGGSGQAEMDLPKTPTVDYSSAADRYQWNGLGGFTDPGTYQVFYFAKDDITENVSPLMETKVYKAKTGNAIPNGFSLVSPDDGASVLTTLVLDWEDTTDPDGDSMSYTVLFSKGDPFFNNPIRIEDLDYSTCLASPAHGIEDLSTYYWKVQAIDEYGAIQETAVRVFHTNNTNPVAAWINGHVYDSISGQSIASAVVSVGNVELTSASGGYYLGLVPPGTYTITASATGYNAKSYPDVMIPDADLVTKDFALLREGSASLGDIDGDLVVDLADAILALQVMAGNQPSATIFMEADVNGDGRIGLEEAIYIMQRVAGVR